MMCFGFSTYSDIHQSCDVIRLLFFRTWGIYSGFKVRPWCSPMSLPCSLLSILSFSSVKHHLMLYWLSWEWKMYPEEIVLLKEIPRSQELIKGPPSPQILQYHMVFPNDPLIHLNMLLNDHPLKKDREILWTFIIKAYQWSIWIKPSHCLWQGIGRLTIF